MSGRPPLFVRRLRALLRQAFPEAQRAGSAVGSRAKAGRVHGFVDGCAQGEIRGWAVDPDHPDRRVHVIAVCDGQVVSEALADLPRADLLQAGRGDGRHGFRLRLPPALLDGQPRAVQVRGVAGGRPEPLKRGEVALETIQEAPLAGRAELRKLAAADADAPEPDPTVVLAVWPAADVGLGDPGWEGDLVRLGEGVDPARLADAHTIVFAHPGDRVAAETAALLTRSRPLADVITWDGSDPASRRPEARAVGLKLGETLAGRFAIRGHVLTLAGSPLIEALRSADPRAVELCLAARPELRWSHLPARLITGAGRGYEPMAPPANAPDRLSLAIWPRWDGRAAASLEALLADAPAVPLQVLVEASGAEAASAVAARIRPGAPSITVQAVDAPAEDTPGAWLSALGAAASGDVAVICQAGVQLSPSRDSIAELAAWAISPGVGAVTIPIAGGQTPLAGLALERTGEGWSIVSAYSQGLEGRSRPVLAAPAAFLAVARDRLAVLGGPADKRLPAGGVDLDLGLRQRRLGLAGVLLGHLGAVAGAGVQPAGELSGPALGAFDASELAAAAVAYPGP